MKEENNHENTEEAKVDEVLCSEESTTNDVTARVEGSARENDIDGFYGFRKPLG
ncbi:MAG: hypothetical protein ACK5N8_08415 [Alphaproteobacteria bacterium]